MPLVVRTCSAVDNVGHLRHSIHGGNKSGYLTTDNACVAYSNYVLSNHKIIVRKGTSSLWRNWRVRVVGQSISPGGCTDFEHGAAPPAASNHVHPSPTDGQLTKKTHPIDVAGRIIGIWFAGTKIGIGGTSSDLGGTWGSRWFS